VSITKEKFIVNKQVNFNLEKLNLLKTAEEEELIKDLTKASNHSYYTFNYIYTSLIIIGINTILYRVY
jgi:hypothetical protein